VPPSRADVAEAVPRRDRRALRLPGHPGRSSIDHLPQCPRVGVVGGGIAGVAAAVALAERGVAVTLLEQESSLGGRLRGWACPEPEVDGNDADGEDPARIPRRMTRGFHAFFRQYYNLRGLLKRIDPQLHLLRPVPDYPLLHRNGTRESFAGLPAAPPWNMLGFVLRSPTFRVRDVARMDMRTAMRLFDVSVPRTYEELDTTDAVTFLDRVGFPPAARHLAFEVFSRSFFADPRLLSAAELAAMFHIYFLGSSEGLLFDVPRDDFETTLWAPFRTHLESLRVEVRTGTRVLDVTRSSSGFQLRHTDGEQHLDALVLALDTAGLRRLIAASPTLGDEQWRNEIADLGSAPPFLVTRLWLDRPAAADRPAFLGTSGFELLDNISLLELFEDHAARWRRATGGSVVELHAYALPEGHAAAGHQPPPALLDRLLADMGEVYPELRGAQVRHSEHVVAADCPLFAPGRFASRPPVSTPDPELVLAGDLVRIDLPVALMERAATTGIAAANALLRRWDVAGHDLWSVSNEGYCAPLRAMARRTRPAPVSS
jgi:isorenieratene synthase